MPWKGTSSLLSSLPITNSGSSWTLARVMKGTESSGLSKHFWWSYSGCIYSPCIMGFPWQQAHVSGCYIWRGCIVQSPLSGKSDHVPLPSSLSEWAPPIVSPLFPCDMHREKCQRPASKILKPQIPLGDTEWMASAPKTLGMVVADQKLGPRPLSCSHLAPGLGWVLRAVTWKDHLDTVHQDFVPECSLWGGTKENSMHDPGIVVLYVSYVCLLVIWQTW